MEAELVDELPRGAWQYEPKWDGFRGVLENDGGELAFWSRNERPLLRYFPELGALGELMPPHTALDGEIVIARNGVLDFDSMQMRLHPAESRVNKLAGLDGVVAKRLGLPYLPGSREGVVKVKQRKTADCVVASGRKASAPSSAWFPARTPL